MTSNQQLVLPFTAQSENRKERLTPEMEEAAVYCLSELERAKGGGLILKQQPERTTFVTKIYYPIWLLPWSDTNLLFDGLSTSKHSIRYKQIPDAKTFQANATTSSKTIENYTDLLQNNANFFRTSNRENELVVTGLLTGKEMSAEFDQYLNEAKQIQDPLTDGVVLASRLDETTLGASAEEIDTIKLQFQKEVEALASSMKLLNKTTNSFIKTIKSKIKATKEQFAEKIRKEEEAVTPKLALLREDYDAQIAKLSQDFEKQLAPIDKEKTRLEKTKEQTTEKIESSHLEAKTAKTRKDKITETEWKEKIKELKKQLSDTKKEIQATQEKMRKIQEQKSLEAFRLKSEFETRTTEAKKGLLELEATRDSEIQKHKLQIDRLQKQTTEITNEAENMAKMREADIDSMQRMGIRQRYPKLTSALMPFYIICYQSDSKRRYVAIPPSVANNVSFSAKLKGALGMPKIKQLLNQRFKTIGLFVNNFATVIENDAILERELTEESLKADIVKTENLKQQVKNGIELLNSEGWFSEKEYTAFKQELV